MEYRVVSAVNNNIVLARDPHTGEQIVLMSKGIGFGRRHGDIVSDNAEDRQIYKLWPNANSLKPLQSSTSNISQDKIQALTKDVVALAEKELGIKNSKLYGALLDHIQFAIDRLTFGLPIENPFSHEISLLYPSEYKTARKVVHIIRERLKVNVGEAETGFIALHLHSAAKSSSIDVSMRTAQFYKDVVQLLEAEGIMDENGRRIFMQSLISFVDFNRKNADPHFPFPNWSSHISAKNKTLLAKIKVIIQKDFQLELSDGALGFIATDIEKLLQASAKS